MTMDREPNEATKAELNRLEMLLMDPAMRREPERVAGLLTEDFTEFGSSGRVWTRATILELLATETYAPPAVDSFACRMLDKDVVLVTYRAVRTTGAKDEQTVTLRSSIWTRKSGRWKICFHQATQVQGTLRKLME